MENCLGMLPPAGNCWIFVRAPEAWSISKVKMGSDVISVLLVGSKLGIFRVPSPREDTSRNLLSGCERLEQRQDSRRRRRTQEGAKSLTEMAISAAVVSLLGTVSFRPWVLLR